MTTVSFVRLRDGIAIEAGSTDAEAFATMQEASTEYVALPQGRLVYRGWSYDPATGEASPPPPPEPQP